MKALGGVQPCAKRRSAVRSPAAYSAASTRVLSAEYSNTLRKVQSATPQGTVAGNGGRINTNRPRFGSYPFRCPRFGIPVSAAIRFCVPVSSSSFRRICNPPHINIRIFNPEKYIFLLCNPMSYIVRAVCKAECLAGSQTLIFSRGGLQIRRNDAAETRASKRIDSYYAIQCLTLCVRYTKRNV